MPDRNPSNVAGASASSRSSRAAERAAWADEVAIDFLSVPALVARVRDAFVDEDGAPGPLRADVALTPGQADEGLELPVVVTQRRACPSCSGRGEAWLEPCPRCAGRGEQTTTYDVVVTIPPHARDGDRFFVALAGTAPPAGLTLRVVVAAAEPSAIVPVTGVPPAIA